MSVFPLTLPVKVLLLGAGELGKELVISLQRLGCPVVACDSYAGAPAMSVASESRVLDMTDAAALTAVIAEVKPDLIVPEVEKLAPAPLVAAARAGTRVMPSARVVQLTFDRQGIRRVAAEVAGVPTSPYAFADSYDSLVAGARAVGLPCFVKPTMSSSGHGQSRVTHPNELRNAWETASSGARADTGKVIVEGEIAFDYEITLLAVRHLTPAAGESELGAAGGVSQMPDTELARSTGAADEMAGAWQVQTSFCAPIGHRQEAGDYAESWQPATMSPLVLEKAKDISRKVLDALADETRQAPHEPGTGTATTSESGESAGQLTRRGLAGDVGSLGAIRNDADAVNPMLGLFGVELFVQGEDVFFSELSPRPHDTGMVTMVTQAQNEFDLHVRAILGLPVDTRMRPGVAAGASVPIKSAVESAAPRFEGIAVALAANAETAPTLVANVETTPTLTDASSVPASTPRITSLESTANSEVQLRFFGKPAAHPGRRMGVALATGADTTQACALARATASRITIIG